MKNRDFDLQLDNIFVDFLKIDHFLSLKEKFKDFFYGNMEDNLGYVSYSKRRDFDYLAMLESNRYKYNKKK